jgi:hypothetical protein
MAKFKNLKMEPAKNGFIIKYDCYEKSSMDSYDGEKYIGEKKEVYEGASEAVSRLMELYEDPNNYEGGSLENYNQKNQTYKS